PMKPAREPDGWGNRRRVMIYLPDHNLILSEHYVNPTERVPGVDREQQIWTYRHGAPRKEPRVEAPTDVRVRTSSSAALGGWQASKSQDIAEYHVYRGEGPQYWTAEYKLIGKAKRGDSSFADAKVTPGKVYFYFIRAVTAKGQESGDSLHVRTQPRIVED